jgi:hypothetical protein
MELAEPEARWVPEATKAFLHELRLYGRTALALARRPREFGRAWGDGQLRTLNPLAFAATTLAVLTIVGLIDSRLFNPAPGGGQSSLLSEALKAGGMYLHLTALGVLSQFVLALRRGIARLPDRWGWRSTRVARWWWSRNPS